MRCKNCDVESVYYDTVSRRILFEDRRTVYISIERFRCPKCHSVRRDLNDQLRFKHYDKEFIFSCLSGKDTSTYEYPAVITIYRWSQEFHLL